jgi:hypothetical protein
MVIIISKLTYQLHQFKNIRERFKQNKKLISNSSNFGVSNSSNFCIFHRAFSAKPNIYNFNWKINQYKNIGGKNKIYIQSFECTFHLNHYYMMTPLLTVSFEAKNPLFYQVRIYNYKLRHIRIILFHHNMWRACSTSKSTIICSS